MNNLYILIVMALFLFSCSAAPPEKYDQTAIDETTINQPASSLPPTLTSTQTQEPTSTNTVTPTATITPTITQTPTEDLSFYNVATCIPQNTSYQRGTVTNTIDGDTIDVRLEDGNEYSVRYIGIDAPENDRPYFDEARNANSDMVLQKEVILIKDESEVDQYERLLRYVIVDYLFVNLEMVRGGFAQTENYPPDEACAEAFTGAERAARDAFIGMWAATQTPKPSAGQVIILTVNKREEWVDIKNVGNSNVELAGWNLVSERGHQECPLSGMIKAGEILRIWAMTAQGPGFSCGYSTNIWNNSESDPAVLYNAQGVEVSRK